MSYEESVITNEVFKKLKMSLDVHISEPDEFNCLELHSSIKEVANIRGIHDFVYHVDCISGKKVNYVANVFRVEIKETDNGHNNVSVIVKTLVNTERQIIFHELHKREVIAYNRVTTKFLDLQEGLDEENRLVLSKCLYSRAEPSNEVIILEDLKTRGFEIEDKLTKYELLDFKDVSYVLSELAKFHALSFVFEKQYPELFDEVKSEFHDILFQSNFLNKTKLKDYFHNSFEMSLNYVTYLDAKEKLEKVQSKLLEILQMFLKPGRINVLCHGDCWVNNMLFKCEANEQTKVCFIDFQAMRYANPFTDIIYFLYICTDSTFRSEHLEQLKSIYYDSLKLFLNLYDIDVNSVYPREGFENDLQDFLPYGVLIAMIELRIVTMTPEDEAILNGSKTVPGTDAPSVPGETGLFGSRVNDVVREAVENGSLAKLLDIINS